MDKPDLEQFRANAKGMTQENGGSIEPPIL